MKTRYLGVTLWSFCCSCLVFLGWAGSEGAEIKLTDGTTVQRLVHVNEQGIVFATSDGQFTKRYPRGQIDLSGIPQDWKAKVDEYDAKARAAEQKRREAKINSETAKKEFEDAMKRSEEERAASEKRDNERLAKAIENPIGTSHKIIIHFPEKLGKDKYYVVSNAVFRGLSDTYIDRIPGITLSSDGLQSIVDTNTKRKFVGFDARDSEGEMFFRYVGAKSLIGEDVIKLKSGAKIDIIGRPIVLDRTGGDMGIMVVKIILHEPPAGDKPE